MYCARARSIILLLFSLQLGYVVAAKLQDRVWERMLYKSRIGSYKVKLQKGVDFLPCVGLLHSSNYNFNSATY